MHSKSTRALLVLVAVLAMSAVAASSALAAGIPYVEAKPATKIGKNEATLAGTVDADAAETKYHFEYGTSTSYGSSTPEVSAGSGTTFVEELQKIGNLLADKAYDFRIVAKNSYGTADGANEKFTTTGPKVPSAEGAGASAVTETNATLNGVLNPNGVETKYYFEYGTTESYGAKTAEASAGSGSANVNENAAISGLTPKTTYHFRLVATDTYGTTYSEGGTFYSKEGPEFRPVAHNKKFTAASGTVRWTLGAESITCSKSATTAEITSAMTIGNVVVKYTGCTWKTSTGATCPVHSGSGGSEEILTDALRGELGLIVPKPASGSDVGLLLTGAEKENWGTLESSCGWNAALQGSLAGLVEPVGKKVEIGSLTFALNEGKQGIREITLDSGVVAKPRFSFLANNSMTLEAEDSLKFGEEAVEVT